MKDFFQKTIAKEGSISGVGIHTGVKSALLFRPAPINTGLQFFRGGSKIFTSGRHEEVAGSLKEALRRTVIGTRDNHVQTVEHLMAALSGLGITNLEIEIEGPEIPALDGSALPFVKLLRGLGLVEQSAKKEIYKVTEPIFFSEDGKAICVYPADDLSIAYTLDYDHPYLKGQKVDFTVTPEIFEREIAPARTFCTEAEAAALKNQGFGLGADLQNTIVISEKGPVQGSLRFPDECARHKVLDILGDLNLLGFYFVGRVVGLRSGHSLNRKLVEGILAQRQGNKERREDMESNQHRDISPNKPMEFEEIKKILPHRYPFLLVDRIIEMNDKGAVGVKNVSGSEPFFQGHFPDKPIMPGVLIIEALAQVGGVLLLSKSENRGKLAYLISVKEAKFRRTVVPGDQLRLEIKVVKMKSKVGIIKCVAKVGDEEACDAEIMFALVG